MFNYVEFIKNEVLNYLGNTYEVEFNLTEDYNELDISVYYDENYVTDSMFLDAWSRFKPAVTITIDKLNETGVILNGISFSITNVNNPYDSETNDNDYCANPLAIFR